MAKRYDTCKHVQRVGALAVYVTPGCPGASMIKGFLVSSKKRCEECKEAKG